MEKIPIYLFQTASAGSMIPLLSPESLGGFGNLQESLQKIEAKDEAERNKQITTVGNIVKILVIASNIKLLVVS